MLYRDVAISMYLPYNKGDNNLHLSRNLARPLVSYFRILVVLGLCIRSHCILVLYNYNVTISRNEEEEEEESKL